MKKKKIDWHNDSFNLNQAISSGVQFALCSEDYGQCHAFAYCKDYLQDAIFSILNKKEVAIYGFSFNPASAKYLPSLKKTLILITNTTDSETRNKIPACLDFINQIEDKLKIPRTTIDECDSPPVKYKNGIFLFSGHKRWINSPPMLSLYTLLIRIGFKHKEKSDFNETISGIVSGKITTHSGIDQARLSNAITGINRILEEGDVKVFGRVIKKNYPAKLPTDTMHNYCGIIGFSNKVVEKNFPHWYKSKNLRKAK